jgi:hypothetical protein
MSDAAEQVQYPLPGWHLYGLGNAGDRSNQPYDRCEDDPVNFAALVLGLVEFEAYRRDPVRSGFVTPASVSTGSAQLTRDRAGG